MRLAVVSPFVDRRHGTERALAELLERLTRDFGCEIHLYAERVEDLHVDRVRRGHGREPEAVGRTGAGVICWHKVPAIPGPHVLHFANWLLLNSALRAWDQWSSGLVYDLVLSPGINCLKPDVVIVHALFHRLRHLAEQASGKPAADNGAYRRWHRQIYYRLLVALERRIYRDTNIKIAAVSQRTANSLDEYFQRKDAVIALNGVDTAEFSAVKRVVRRDEARRVRGFRHEECVLLLIGNDWQTKGLPAVLEAMVALDHLPLRLLVVGSDVPGHFHKLATQLRLWNRCTWELPRQDVLDIYAAADIYVSPSHEDSFGLPVAEAMACGLPAITSRFAGVADLMCDGVDGYVLENPRDVRTLAKVIAQLADDPELRGRVGEAARCKAEQFSWDRHTKVVWDLLQNRVPYDAKG